jgi:hypothetical protein
MPLKNRTSQGKNTFDKISRILAENGAKKVMFDYSNDGKMEAISFAIEIEGQLSGFKLPAMVENVTEIMFGGEDRHGNKKKVTDAQREQAYKTAWANVRDWIDAQVAMITTKQVKIEQVFLPYMVMKDGNTLYENMKNQNLLLK